MGAEEEGGGADEVRCNGISGRRVSGEDEDVPGGAK